MLRRTFVSTLAAAPLAQLSAAPANDLWDLARNRRQDHVFSTLFEAQTVSRALATDEGVQRAIDWCRRYAVTKVYIESFRDGHQAERAVLANAKKKFLAAGFEVCGCVTTLGLGRRSTGWKLITCFTDPKAQERLREVFEYTASLVDEIMIDDFWFTDCTCNECDRARRARTVTIGGRTSTAAGDTWEDYRRELMARLSREYVLAAAKKVNPRATLIIKYPQWYDNFHERGYDVVVETADFDKIWVGTETRNRSETGKVQYEGYFIMRWLAGIGGAKTGGGWFEPYQTSEINYVEQARQTVLAGARESVLFCYGALTRGSGAKNIEALRPHFPALLDAAREVRRRSIVGIAAYKPANSHPEKEQYIYDFAGMLGLPLVPCHEFPESAPAAFFPVHALKDADFGARLGAFVEAGKPVLLTGGLAERLKGKAQLDRPNVYVLPPKPPLELTQAELDALRKPLLAPLRASFEAPNQVALYLFSDGSYAIENFNDEPVAVKLNGKPLRVGPRDWTLAFG